jgi:transcription-repair coupling factor (superfamily II helicase)
LTEPWPAPDSIKNNLWHIRVGKTIDRARLINDLVTNEFTRLGEVSEPREFSVRGGIIDIFPPDRAKPLRLELFGNQVESIRTFSVSEQVSDETLAEVKLYLVPPVTETQPVTTLLDFLSKETIVILRLNSCEMGKATSQKCHCEERSDEAISCFPHKTEIATLPTVARNDKIEGFMRFARVQSLDLFPYKIYFQTLPVRDGSNKFNYETTSLVRFQGGLSGVITELQSLINTGREVIIYYKHEAERQRFRELTEATPLKDHGAIKLKPGILNQGFIFPEINTVFTSYNELFNRYRERRRFRTGAEPPPLESFLDLAVGDLVVHTQYGIGRYQGIKFLPSRSSKGGSASGRDGGYHNDTEHLVIRYADSALVYVPVSEIDLVQKYIGGGERAVELSRLGTGLWEARKARARNAVASLARELLEIQALRTSVGGIAFATTPEWYQEFEALFPYEETPDQVKVMEAIDTDMARAAPMDRLICGDVGYGKTELAMRAAFRAATAGYQVAVLVPTTVLAQQHYTNFSERMADFPLTVEMLSRFRHPAEQARIIEQLATGQIDIIIGTHRLIQPDIRFKNLGLVIIDEEQRFGVVHKERLKHLRATVDVLTLTATPIPRTLHMALLGIRDISVLTTPPLDRRAIEAHLSYFDPELIRLAIKRELARGGQVYFVHNHVADIELLAQEIHRIVPEATYTIVHGQLPEDELAQRMQGFIEGKFDVLVCTNIIESGLDIPRVNTIFVNNADDFGLSDLHQLRGRVGRYKYKAYAYFLLPRERAVNEEATKRLKAIQEFSELGAGFKIAMRDMEIRGVGNILGAEQHGHIAAIGYDLYLRLLQDALHILRNEPVKSAIQPHISLALAAYLPDEYIPTEKVRLEFYRRLSRAETSGAIDEIAVELTDRFGKPLPEPVWNLLEVAKIKLAARQLGLTSLVQPENACSEPSESKGNGLIVVQFLNEERVKALKKKYPRTIRIIDEHTMHLIIPADIVKSPHKLLAYLRKILR